MNFYNVSLTIQNFGSKWKLIIRGTPDKLELAINSLLNWQACPDVEKLDEWLYTAWSSEEDMRRYCMAKTHFHGEHDGEAGDCDECLAATDEFIAALKNNTEEFQKRYKEYSNETYENGTVKAEKPDSTFQDAVLEHAFQDKNLA